MSNISLLSERQLLKYKLYSSITEVSKCALMIFLALIFKHLVLLPKENYNFAYDLFSQEMRIWFHS